MSEMLMTFKDGNGSVPKDAAIWRVTFPNLISVDNSGIKGMLIAVIGHSTFHPISWKIKSEKQDSSTSR
jgi:hypothetical protein